LLVCIGVVVKNSVGSRVYQFLFFCYFILFVFCVV